MTCRRKIYLRKVHFRACVAIVRDHYLFLFTNRSAKTAYVLPSIVPGCIHYYSFTTIYKSLPDEEQISKPNATIQPSDSGPLVRRRDRLLPSSASGGPPRSSRGIFLKQVPSGQRKRKWSTPPKKLLERFKPLEKWFWQGTLALPPAQVFFCRPLLN